MTPKDSPLVAVLFRHKRAKLIALALAVGTKPSAAFAAVGILAGVAVVGFRSREVRRWVAGAGRSSISRRCGMPSSDAATSARPARAGSRRGKCLAGNSRSWSRPATAGIAMRR